MCIVRAMNSVTDTAYVRSAAQGMLDSLVHYGYTSPPVGDGRMSTPAWYANRLGKVFNARYMAGMREDMGQPGMWWGTMWEAYARTLLSEMDN